MPNVANIAVCGLYSTYLFVSNDRIHAGSARIYFQKPPWATECQNTQVLYQKSICTYTATLLGPCHLRVCAIFMQILYAVNSIKFKEINKMKIQPLIAGFEMSEEILLSLFALLSMFIIII